MTRDTAASIRARLLNKAKQANEEFELFLVRYASERFLHRLGSSEFRDRCILKGASLIALWMEDPYRATRDIDLLAQGPSDEAAIRDLVATVCRVSCPEDGLDFDLEKLDVSPIRAEEKYAGRRVVLRAMLGTARIRLQIDFGFGDAVFPEPIEAELPSLLTGLPVATVRAYSKENSLAEKLEAMVQLGRRNSRMKDFHDLWAISSAFAFDGEVFRRALLACFECRGTDWTSEDPDVLNPGFYDDVDLQARWSAYLRSGAFKVSPPASFVAIGRQVVRFVELPRASIAARRTFAATWPPGGPWKLVDAEPR